MIPKRKLEIKDDGQTHEHLKEENDQEPEQDSEQGVGIKPKRRKRVSEATKTCNVCSGALGKNSFSAKQWKGVPSHIPPPTCKSCVTKVNHARTIAKKTCQCCNVKLDRSSFSKSQWRSGGKNVCKSCIDEVKVVRVCKMCQSCEKVLPKTSFFPSQWKGPLQKTTRSCKDCCEKVQGASDIKQCSACKVLFEKESFTHSQWNGAAEKVRCCKVCMESVSVKEERACHRCKNFLTKGSFSNSQWKRNQNRVRSCKSCVLAEKPKSASKKQRLDEDSSTTETETENDASTVDSEHQKDTSGKSKTQQQSGKKPKKETKQKFENDPAVIKRMLTERLNNFPKNRERMSFQFDWDSAPISQEDESNMASYIIVKGCYGRMTKQEKDDLAKYIENSSTRMVASQAISLRSALLQQKSMFRHAHLQKNAKALFEKYQAGESILRLSQDFDYPPMNAFRTMLAMSGHGKTKIKKCLRDPKKELNARDQREYAEAESADSVSNVNQQITREFADMFEDIISSFLKKKGICFVRQN